ncbi:M67 family metallopeptidase [Prochlorothrix hollandica]|uniref:JAB1/MPN/MOV34 metalloenzyme domain-containing protein n=1 Tax=Prochlorothrix hollandica PCC 9006 = CALU 1027 TaxID=317619 RepID=A0A0M2PTW6_PROHO|nr:M67 family metallopeptidase [Prochlorothrix hollandica]KKI98577.1 hypothetical protein PROH_16925 [Prochlorothrix hollandica PCC 9006 = CALU 1027]
MLYLTSPHLAMLRHHAAQTYPEECCGLLLGTLGGDRKQCHEILPTANAWVPPEEGDRTAALGLDPGYPGPTPNHRNPSRRDRFAIDPRDLLQAQRDGRHRKLVIIGIYHSHPDHPAQPSERDRVAAWPHYSYLILSVSQGNTVDYRSWSLNDRHQFQSEAVIVTPDQGHGL